MDQVMGNKACLLDKTYIAITLVTLSLRDEKTRQMSFCVCVCVGLWTLSTSGISCRTSGKAKAHLLQKASPLSSSLTPTLKGGYWPPWTRVSLRLLCPPLITLFPALLHPSEGRLQRETLPEACPTCVSWGLIFPSTF